VSFKKQYFDRGHYFTVMFLRSKEKGLKKIIIFQAFFIN